MMQLIEEAVLNVDGTPNEDHQKVSVHLLKKKHTARKTREIPVLDKRSICFVSPFGYPLLIEGAGGSGGAERQFFLFGRALSANGWRVSFITNPPSTENLNKKPRLPAISADLSYLGGSKWRLPANWWSLLKAMRKANSYFYALKVPGHILPLMAVFCRLNCRKLVFWAQTSFDADPNKRTLSPLIGSLQDIGIRYADVVIAQSNEQQTGFADHRCIAAHIVRSICDLITPKTPPLEDDFIDVLWAGNSLGNKRPEVLLELAVLMPDVRFAMAMNVGDRSSFEEMELKARAIPNLHFLGQVPPLEMELWFSRTRVVLNTSGREGFPNTFLQAWMNSVPVVSLQVDPDGLIRKEEVGVVVSEEVLTRALGDTVSLARCLVPHVRRLLSDEELRLEMGRRGKRYVETNHSPTVVVSQLITALLNSGSRII